MGPLAAGPIHDDPRTRIHAPVLDVAAGQVGTVEDIGAGDRPTSIVDDEGADFEVSEDDRLTPEGMVGYQYRADSTILEDDRLPITAESMGFDEADVEAPINVLVYVGTVFYAIPTETVDQVML